MLNDFQRGVCVGFIIMSAVCIVAVCLAIRQAQQPVRQTLGEIKIGARQGAGSAFEKGRMENESGVAINIQKMHLHHRIKNLFHDIANKMGYAYVGCMSDAIQDFTVALVDASYASPQKQLIDEMIVLLNKTSGLTPEMQVWLLNAEQIQKCSANF